MKKLLLIFIILFVTNATDASTVVLPSRFEKSKVLTVNTKEYEKYIEENKGLKAQLVQENKNWLDYSNSIENQVKYNSDVQSKLLNDFNKAKIDIATKNATIAKERITILCQWILIGSIFAALGALLYFRILKISILPF